jgi:tripartite ATP-independent transporter DctP family solute receptor
MEERPMPRNKTTRRRAMAGAGGLAAATILRWPAGAAEFNFKFGAASPMEHPAMVRSKEAADNIRRDTNGQVDISLYPSSQLGSDSSMIAQVVSGAIQMFLGALDLVAARNPVCGISGVGFAFSSYDQIWAAMDGDLGAMLRGLVDDLGLHALDQPFDHGYRDITTRTKPIVTPDDLRGLKIRLPVAPFLISLFRHLGASPTALSFGEVYSALQTGLVDAQENPLVLVDTGKLYEVQKYCSLTGHVWAGLYVSVNKAAWGKLTPALRDIVQGHFTAAVTAERQDFTAMTRMEEDNLTAKGMRFNPVDVAPFRAVLAKSGYYPDMKKVAGDKAWGLLEKYVGPLAA